jgi:hypothetical protein
MAYAYIDLKYIALDIYNEAGFSCTFDLSLEEAKLLYTALGKEVVVYEANVTEVCEGKK